MSETSKFMGWYEQEKAKGLVDVKFFTGNLSDATTESVFKEVNELNDSDRAVRKGRIDTLERRPAAEVFASLGLEG